MAKLISKYVLIIILICVAHIRCGKSPVMRSYFASTVDGLEPVLLKEVMSLPEVYDCLKVKCGVQFKGTDMTGFSSILWLRTSLKVCEVIKESTGINTKDDLWRMCSDVNWSSFLSNSQTLKCDTVVGQSSTDLSHTHFSSLTVKNAVVDQFRERNGKRPNVDIGNPDLPLFLYIHRSKATLYRVWSGVDSMHKRGYRDTIHKASLRETTAAALVYLSKWNPHEQIFIDPMGGSGTIAVEAALIACNTAPGLIKYVDRGCTPKPISWPGIDAAIWDEALRDAQNKDLRSSSKSSNEQKKLIYYNDIHSGAYTMAKTAAQNAGVSHLIEFSNSDISEYKLHSGESQIMNIDTCITNEARQDVSIVTNPPWDRRLEGADEAWEKLGDFCKSIGRNNGIQMWALTGNEWLLKLVKISLDSKFQFNAANSDLIFAQFCNDEKFLHSTFSLLGITKKSQDVRSNDVIIDSEDDLVAGNKGNYVIGRFRYETPSTQATVSQSTSSLSVSSLSNVTPSSAASSATNEFSFYQPARVLNNKISTLSNTNTTININTASSQTPNSFLAPLTGKEEEASNKALTQSSMKNEELTSSDALSLSSMKNEELKNMCRAIGLPVSGTKAVLVQRILEKVGHH